MLHAKEPDHRSGVSGVEGHRRRRQRDLMAETQNETQVQAEQEPASGAAQMPAEHREEKPTQADSPHRRRRKAQPPAQITQRIPKLSVPDARDIPRLPKIEDEEPKKPVRMTGKKPKKANKPKAEHKMIVTAQQAARISGAAAKTVKTVLEAVGGVLLLALMLGGEGIRKLGSLIASLVDRAKKAHAPAEAAQQEEIVLEAIRPQDYHGRGAQHAKAQTADREKASPVKKTGAAKIDGQRIISAALVIVALVSAWQIGSILLRSFRTNRLNSQLSERYGYEAADSGEDAEDVPYDAPDGEDGEELAFVVYEGETPTPVPAAEPTAEPQDEPEDDSVEGHAAQAADAAQSTPAPELVKTTKFHHMGGDALPEMAALYEENRDLVAWINIPDVIDLPIVYKDNSYYLKRDFYKQKNASGTIFLDENHPFKEKTQNLLLHGHNMKDGTMFGRLTQYIYDRTYIKNHPFINLSTLWRKEQYVIFAILDVSLDPKNENFFNYFTHDTFYSDAEFTSYIRQLQLRSMVAIPIDVDPSDALLTLSTCLEENRLVIVARRLRDGETRAELRQRIHTSTRQ